MSVIPLQTAKAEVPAQGAAMDRVLAPKRRRPVLVAASVLALLGTAGAGAMLWRPVGSAQTVRAGELGISVVKAGTFDDFVPLRGRVTPLVTVFLDAVEGGRIERVLVEDGAEVVAGQPLAVLSNATLQLDVIAREADVSQQLNNLRTQELMLQRSRLENRRALAEVEWQMRTAERQVERDRKLAAGGWISAKAVRDNSEEAAYLARKTAMTRESMATEERLQASQLAQLRTSAQQLTANLRLARASLEALTIRAPVAGSLSGFNPQVGQSLNRGERLGQVDSAGRSKLVAEIDEFYLGRVRPGQQATVEWAGKTHRLRVGKLYPQVQGGSFTAELLFDGAEPVGLQRGQTLQPKLTLGDPVPALLLPAGGFLAESGGAFVFVVDADGRTAEKRAVKLGRRNPDFIEVLSGLRAGERVVTSSYAGLADKDRLKIRK